VFKIKFFKIILKTFVKNLFNKFLNFFLKKKKKKIKNYIYNNVNYNIFSSFKFIKIKYDKDLINIIDFYNSIGFRDMFILKNILINSNNNKLLDVNINLHEGNNYFIKNIK